MAGSVYLMRNHALHKIGISQDPERRRRDIELNSGLRTELVFRRLVDDPELVEAYLHDMFWYCRRHGEWFAMNEREVARAIDFIQKVDGAMVR